MNRPNPDAENIRVNPAEVVEKIQQDVEQKDSEPEEGEETAAGEEDVKKDVE